MTRILDRNCTCNECPMYRNAEIALGITNEDVCELQLKYCGGDVPDENKPEQMPPKPRKTGRAYRRKMRRRKRKNTVKTQTPKYYPYTLDSVSKRRANKIIRRYNDHIPNGSAYRSYSKINKYIP